MRGIPVHGLNCRNCKGISEAAALKPDSAYQVTEIEKVDWTMFLVRRLFWGSSQQRAEQNADDIIAIQLANSLCLILHESHPLHRSCPIRRNLLIAIKDTRGMATVSRKRKSPEPSDHHALEHDNNVSTPRTPNGSPARKRLRITLSQKQALIDNLQLEVTERARKLRAHYALQAQDLRGRIERRINRIPTALRKEKMGDLLAKYSDPTRAVDAGQKSGSTKTSKSSSRAATGQAKNPADGHDAATTTRTTRGAKRTSDDMLASGKENAPFQVQDHHSHPTPAMHVPLSNPKKRGTPNAHPAGQHPRVLSQFAETGVLSPKSSNSRTFPQSPLRNVTGKSQQQLGASVRPSSPLKHTSPVKPARAGVVEHTKTRSTRGTTTTGATGARKVTPHTNDGTGTRRRTTAKSTTSTTSKRVTAASATAPPSRPATRQRNTRRNSGASTVSNVSSGTTIVKTTGRGGGGAAGSQKGAGSRPVSAASKRPPVPRAGMKKTTSTAGTGAGAGTGSVIKKAQATEEPAAAAGQRVLRKRA
ncbi:conserved hypothetical protein [Histoplasma capsulatum H143]|uniref:Borealin N-terminal domain-containing protein n=1 Tax=Ajellomyces capsulatus (strain H143) TaxID=544712 RepID=C6HRA7_AJECH|nr:conserved hypothetical protein [Histoplasma capsulatum H143]